VLCLLTLLDNDPLTWVTAMNLADLRRFLPAQMQQLIGAELVRMSAPGTGKYLWDVAIGRFVLVSKVNYAQGVEQVILLVN